MRGAVAVLSVLAAVALLSGPSVAQAPTSGRIAFIDLQRVLVRSAAGIAAREQLEREKGAMQREMDTKRQEVDKLREDLEKKGSLLTGEARREKEDQLERKRRDAARLADDFQRELTRKEQQLLVKVQQELIGVIEKVGKQKGYYLIVERRGAGILYFTPEADLTDDIIRAYDQESASKGKK